MQINFHAINTLVVVYPPAIFPLNSTEMLQILKMNYWRRNHKWIFREQDLKEWITRFFYK